MGEPLIGWVCIASGLAIWRFRPQNRCWWLVTAAGFAWYAVLLNSAGNGSLGLVAFALVGWYNGLLVWALLAYPTGRIATRGERIVLVLILGVVVARTTARALLYVPADLTGCGCVTNRLIPAVTDDRWWQGTEAAFRIVYPALVVPAVTGVALRWRRASRPVRRMLQPALVAGTVMAVSAILGSVAGLNTGPTLIPTYALTDWATAAVAVTLAVGFSRLRQTRASVVDLVSELGDDAPPGRLADALRRALEDPNLTLLPWSAERGGYVADDGTPVGPQALDQRTVTRIERRGEPIALLVHDAALLEDPGLVRGVMAAVRLSVDNDRLQAAMEAQVAEVAASRARIVVAGDAERRRIERNLHDGAQQRLVTIALSLKLAEAQMDGTDPATRAALQRAVDELGVAINELRDLARGIHPPLLTESGIAAAVEALTDRFPVPTTLTVDLEREPSPLVSATLYFAIAEALTNVAKHAHAEHVHVRLRADAHEARATVEDDGIGGADASGGTGLRGLADRAAAGGGSMSVSPGPAGGTTIEVRMPCA
ncbi:sensor histidine kinase [Xylanimonas protaetiae]|uniref:sensor histidine kinase n=1 Tax=Xylanimonas protaetiae TaxID=2509457 RepID=UPI0013EB929D|nr:sensor histidine kinase [Xylanimonas protaetiae]